MTNKEKFLALVSAENDDTLEKNSERVKNRAMLRESQLIAMKVLMKLDELGWSQKELAKRMDVSPQQISKIVSGKENLTIETQIKLQTILDIPVLASYYEKKMPEWVLNTERQIEKISVPASQIAVNYEESVATKRVENSYSKEWNHEFAG